MKRLVLVFISTLFSSFLFSQSDFIIAGDTTDIHFHNLNPDITIAEPVLSPIFIDVTNDGIEDFIFYFSEITSDPAHLYALSGSTYVRIPNENIQIAYYQDDSIPAYAALAGFVSGDSISSTSANTNWVNEQGEIYELVFFGSGGGFGGYSGFWQYGEPRYLAFRFLNGTDTTYGYFYVYADIQYNGYMSLLSYNFPDQLSFRQVYNPTPVFGPNPINDKFNILTSNQQTKASFFNMSGQLVFETEFFQQVQLLLNDKLADGFYILRLESPNSTSAFTIFKY